MTTFAGSNTLGISIDNTNIQIISNSNNIISINQTTDTITLTNTTLTGLKSPVNDTDAVTKEYVDQTPFIQLYATTLPEKYSSFNTEWSSVQNNIIQKNGSNIILPIGIYKIELLIITSDNTLILGLCTNNISSFLSSQQQYQQIHNKPSLCFIQQITSQTTLQLYVLDRSNSQQGTKFDYDNLRNILYQIKKINN